MGNGKGSRTAAHLFLSASFRLRWGFDTRLWPLGTSSRPATDPLAEWAVDEFGLALLLGRLGGVGHQETFFGFRPMPFSLSSVTATYFGSSSKP